MSEKRELSPLADWLRPSIDYMSRQADVQRLCRALAYAEGFHFHLVVCRTSRAAAALTLWLAEAVAVEREMESPVIRLSPYPLDPRMPAPVGISGAELADSVLAPLRRLGSGGTGATVLIDACRATDRDSPIWLSFVRRFNEQRNAIARELNGALVLLCSSALEVPFARLAPDMWSIRGLAVSVEDVDETRSSTSLMRSYELSEDEGVDPEALRGEIERVRSEASTGSKASLRVLGLLLLRMAGALMGRGYLDEASSVVDEAISIAVGLQDDDARGACLLARGDILIRRGELDAARRMLETEVIPILQRSGDEWAVANTWHRIADIRATQGTLDEALRIRREEELPVYERLGDVRSRAITMGKVADVLKARGDLDEALRIRREEQLPVYERLGDVRGLLVARSNLALGLLKRDSLGDRSDARMLLEQAEQAASRLRLPEAAQIQALRRRYKL